MEITIQLLLNSIIVASIFAMIGIAFGLIYQSAKYLDLSVAIIFTIGAYIIYKLINILDLPFILLIVLAIIFTAMIGCLLEICFFGPQRNKRASSLILLIMSLGIYIVVQNIISIAFGDDSKNIRAYSIKEGFNVLGAKITSIQIEIILIGIFSTSLLSLLLMKTSFGKSIRAISNDFQLSRISGINANKIILLIFILSSSFASLAGILFALDVSLTPIMGMRILLMGLVAAIIGGIGCVRGVVLGALLLGIAQHLSTLKISSQWQDAIAFGILLVFLIFRPQGFLGKKIKKATV